MGIVFPIRGETPSLRLPLLDLLNLRPTPFDCILLSVGCETPIEVSAKVQTLALLNGQTVHFYLAIHTFDRQRYLCHDARQLRDSVRDQRQSLVRPDLRPDPYRSLPDPAPVVRQPRNRNPLRGTADVCIGYPPWPDRTTWSQ